MVQKIINSLNSINKFSSTIIKVGSYISLTICCIGVYFAISNTSAQESSTYALASSMISTSMLLFSEIVIGSIIIDFFGRMANNNN